MRVTPLLSWLGHLRELGWRDTRAGLFRRASLPLANHPQRPGPALAGMRHALALKGVIRGWLIRADAPEGVGDVHVSRRRGDAERFRETQDAIVLTRWRILQPSFDLGFDFPPRELWAPFIGALHLAQAGILG